MTPAAMDKCPLCGHVHTGGASAGSSSAAACLVVIGMIIFAVAGAVVYWLSTQAQ
jgi:hypothetical protein